jgi:hypothetical protein
MTVFFILLNIVRNASQSTRFSEGFPGPASKRAATRCRPFEHAEEMFVQRSISNIACDGIYSAGRDTSILFRCPIAPSLRGNDFALTTSRRPAVCKTWTKPSPCDARCGSPYRDGCDRFLDPLFACFGSRHSMTITESALEKSRCTSSARRVSTARWLT